MTHHDPLRPPPEGCPWMFRPDGSPRDVFDRRVEALLIRLHGREDAATAFLAGLPDHDLYRYVQSLCHEEGPAPEIGAPEEVGDWLFGVWVAEERDPGHEDPETPARAFDEWVEHMATDRFFRGRAHARYYRQEMQPSLDLPDPRACGLRGEMVG